MKTNRHGIVDPTLFALAVVLSLLGMVIIFDAGYARSMATGKGSVPAESWKQGIYFLISIGVFAATLILRRETLQKFANWIAGFSILTLIYVEIFGKTLNGAKRWISLGPLGDLQPAEFAKIAVILYLAAALANKTPWPTQWPKRWKQGEWTQRVLAPKLERLWPAFVVLVFFVLIEREKDLGTAAVVLVTALAMILSAGVSQKSLLVCGGIMLFGGGLMVTKEAYRMDRINNHVTRWDAGNVDDTGFQTCQSELAMASGAFTGVGFGNGRAKHILPATTTDFVMATVGEELGVLGPLLMLGLMGGVTWRIWRLAKLAETRFAKLVLVGTAWWFVVQACTNLMMANATLPAIGIPFPFISSGGSSLLSIWLAIAICQVVAAPSSAKEGAYASGRDRWGNGRARLSGS